MRVTRAMTAFSVLTGTAIGVSGGGAVAAAGPWPSDLAAAVAQQQMQRMFNQQPPSQQLPPQQQLPEQLAPPPQQLPEPQRPQRPPAACLASALCSWEGATLGGAVWYVKNPHRGEWCTNFHTPRRSGINNTKLDLVLQEGSCKSPRRVFYIKPREKREKFPFAARSVAHCRRCQ